MSVAVLSYRHFLTSTSTPALVFHDGSDGESVELKIHDTSIKGNVDVVVSRSSNLGSDSVEDWCDASSQAEARTKSKQGNNAAHASAERNTDDVNQQHHRHWRLWQAIDNTTAKYLTKNTKVSGGLFLYPRQANLLAKVMEDLISLHRKHHMTRPFQVCETGFGSGHSTAFFLSQSKDVQIVTFDKFDRPYQSPLVKLLEQEFPDKIQHVAGDSCKTVPQFFKESTSIETQYSQELGLPSFQRCDLLHGSSLCKSDNIDLVQHAPCGTILTSTAMHSITDKDVYFGPNAQWRKLRGDQCISDIVCFQEEAKRLDESFIFAKKDEIISHKFCFAVVTGFCLPDTGSGSGVDGLVGGIESKEGDQGRGSKQEKIYDCETQRLAAKDILNKLCQTVQIEVPA